MNWRFKLRQISESITRISNNVFGNRSYRRMLLDEDLERSREFINGIVLDVGGKAKGKEGQFHPSASDRTRWIYLNINERTQPDVIGDAEFLPFRAEGLDSVVCTEVLEHCEYPQKVIDELYRVLREKGHLIISVPFICPIHADPFDFNRFTDRKLCSMLKRFKIIELKKQGYYFTVLADMIKVYLRRTSRIYAFKYFFYPLIPLMRVLMSVEKMAWAQKSERFTAYAAGFFVVSQKIDQV
jgi:SAM-dependent methyltransferase